jgi:diguanylate cyclase (GGDEF)-like protein/PAS domain S-box-containing protein
MVTDAAGVIEYVNPAFEALTGYARDEAVGRTPSLLKSGEHDAEFYRRLWTSLLGGRQWRGVLVDRRKDGEIFHVDTIIRPFAARNGRITHFVAAGRDVSGQVRENERLAHAATHDGLTGLPNRTLFTDRLGQALRQAARRGEGFTVAVFDLDRFRDANNRFGHLAGDAVLREVARRTRGCVREADTVARIGGDEFGVILVGTAQRAAAAPVFEKMLETNAVPIRFEERLIRIGVSIGACAYPRDGATEEELLKRADGAMYAAKRLGGNRCHFYRAREPAQPGRARSQRVGSPAPA